MGKYGGTQMWCPRCQEIQVCSVVNYGTGWDDRLSGHHEFREIQWRVRERECLSCGYSWETYEVEKRFVDELIKSRKVLKELGEIVGGSARDMRRAEYRLRRLSEDVEEAKELTKDPLSRFYDQIRSKRSAG